MGLFRKLTSVSTLGAVDFRSDKERIAKNTRLTRKAAQQSAGLAAAQLEVEQQRLALEQENALRQQQPTAPPAVPTIAEHLRQLISLHEAGALTAEEFAAAKQRLLG